MGINVRLKKEIKPLEIPSYEVKLEKDLKDCMSCRFFYGSSSRCIKERCVKDQEIKQPKPDMDNKCFKCPYRKTEGYCFPCMKQLLGG